MENVQITGPEEWNSSVKIQLIDLQGKLVSEYEMNDKIFQLKFDPTIAPGNYFLNFFQENGLFIQQTKLIKFENQ
jgi:hypothetical protein